MNLENETKKVYRRGSTSMNIQAYYNIRFFLCFFIVFIDDMYSLEVCDCGLKRISIEISFCEIVTCACM